MATITGDTGFNVLEGTSSDEGLEGLLGNDLLLGNDGDDLLLGGGGNDWLFGGEGDDRLDGGFGNDHLTGGDGLDKFIFTGKSGNDVITDFNTDEDMLQIQKSKVIKKIGDVIKHAKQLKNGDLEINLGKGNKIVLKNVDKDDFKQDPSSHIQIID